MPAIGAERHVPATSSSRARRGEGSRGRVVGSQTLTCPVGAGGGEVLAIGAVRHAEDGLRVAAEGMSRAPVSVSESPIVPSSLGEARCRPSGLKATLDHAVVPRRIGGSARQSRLK